ncbi:DNA primase/polymerase [Gordonia phage Hibiscus]
MTNPDNTTDPYDGLGYSDVADIYYTAGWHGVLPLRPGVKGPPPQGFTGIDAPMPSYPDVLEWVERHPNGNVALRLPDTVIGVDVDAYDGKTGAATIALAEQKWGPLPDSPRSSSRDDIASGIRFYRVPAGTRLVGQISFPDAKLGHVELIQHGHRYAVVWPSLHPAGGRYLWINTAGDHIAPPTVDTLPELPAAWIEHLRAEQTIANLPGVDVAGILAALPAGPPSTLVVDRLSRAIVDLAETHDSRHDVTMRHVLALLRHAEQGETGVQSALEALGGAFVNAVTRPGKPNEVVRTVVEARDEYARMVTGHRGHALIAATPTLTLHELAGLPAPTTAREHHDTAELGDDEEADPSPAPPAPVVAADLTREFWHQRDSLARIHQHAYARLCSPWSVLGVALARALAQVPPWITLPPVIGGKGSLNTFVALVGRSGAGKGTSEAAAADLVPVDDTIGMLPVGSGEGLAHAYVRRQPGTRDMVRERQSVMFSVPEVDTLTAIGGRNGATIMSKLREAYSGEEIGFAWADPSKRLLVGKHGYRLTLVLGVQPERAAPLLDDAGGGTPQRFVWLPATDPHIGAEIPDVPPPIHLPPLTAFGGYADHIEVPEVALNTIRAAHIARSRGEGGTLDGHALFTREKVMVGLAVLDGRTACTESDWDLAGTVMDISDATRAAVVDEISSAVAAAAEKRGREVGITRDTADEIVHARRVQRVAGLIRRRLERADDGTLQWHEITKAVASRDRDVIESALVQMFAAGEVTQDVETRAVTLAKLVTK